MASYVQKLFAQGPKLIKFSQTEILPRAKTLWHYSKVELKPPMPSEFSQIPEGFSNLINAAKNQKWKHATIKDVFVNTTVTIEVICWFFIGEVLGKGTLVGYQVPGGTNFEAHI